jgi:hypothetical protein
MSRTKGQFFMFHERQQGDLCRMHALNALVGRREFDPTSFRALVEEFRRENPDSCDPATSDGIHADQQHLMSFALARRGLTTYYAAPHAHAYAMETLGASAMGELVGRSHAVMVLTLDHVFALKMDAAGVWWNLDSLFPAPRRCNFDDVVASDNCGVLFVWDRRHAQGALPILRQNLVDAISQRLPVARLGHVRELDILAALADDLNNEKFVALFEQDLSLFMRYYSFAFGTTSTHVATDMFQTWFARFKEMPGDLLNTIRFIPPLIFWVFQFDANENPDPTPPRARQASLVRRKDGTSYTVAH